ncbi:MAG: hypothetical protein HYU86_08680 [Chloroflexi bacterium]|nr:hypothetical protein [Chloroflexota bacterium]
MTNAYRFERECRTPYSEAYVIYRDDERAGRVDLHFTPSVVYATLCLDEAVSDEQVAEYIETVDEELVMSSQSSREDFVVTVYRGKELGIYSDEDFEEEERENGSHLEESP